MFFFGARFLSAFRGDRRSRPSFLFLLILSFYEQVSFEFSFLRQAAPKDCFSPLGRRPLSHARAAYRTMRVTRRSERALPRVPLRSEFEGHVRFVTANSWSKNQHNQESGVKRRGDFPSSREYSPWRKSACVKPTHLQIPTSRIGHILDASETDYMKTALAQPFFLSSSIPEVVSQHANYNILAQQYTPTYAANTWNYVASWTLGGVCEHSEESCVQGATGGHQRLPPGAPNPRDPKPRPSRRRPAAARPRPCPGRLENAAGAPGPAHMYIYIYIHMYNV